MVATTDLARLYECANGTKSINLAVNRNIERFLEDFYFQLTKEEYNNLGGVRKLPYVFTEQGVAMLATVLRTKVASQMSISIMRAFVTMRKYISSNLIEQKFINKQVLKNTEDIKLLKESFHKLEEKRKVNEIYFNGQIRY
ncbi:MAG: ORF6N domain-containing protein [Bacilli bacterium]|nr:ORF6N domain-containing protein [Bacilli bacterium]